MTVFDSPRDDMAEVFREPRFDRSPSWISRAGSAVRRGVHRVVDAVPFGTLGRFLAWIALALAVAFAVLIVGRAIRRAVARRRLAGGEDAILDDVLGDLDERSAEQWATDAHASEARRDWKEAIRCRYAEIVGTAFATGCAVAEPGRTTGELRRDVAAAREDCADAFAELTDIFELVWFADRAATSASHERVVELGDCIRPRLTGPVHAGVSSRR